MCIFIYAQISIISQEPKSSNRRLSLARVAHNLKHVLSPAIPHGKGSSKNLHSPKHSARKSSVFPKDTSDLDTNKDISMMSPSHLEHADNFKAIDSETSSDSPIPQKPARSDSEKSPNMSTIENEGNLLQVNSLGLSDSKTSLRSLEGNQKEFIKGRYSTRIRTSQLWQPPIVKYSPADRELKRENVFFC